MNRCALIQIVAALLCYSVSTLAAAADAGATAVQCETGDMSKSLVRQKDLIGKWKQTGIEEDGKIKKIKLDLTHEFTNDCKMIATMGGDPSAYSYVIDGGQLVLTSALTGSTYRKDFSKVSKDVIIHGGDVFSRIK